MGASLHGLRRVRALAILAGMRRVSAWWLVVCLGVAGPVSLPGCEATEPAVAPGDPWPAGLGRPADASEAVSLRAGGVAWTDRQVRQLYLERVAEIGPRDQALRSAGQSVEARARAAFEARHEARMTARAMMQDSEAVAALRARDREKYGTPDGPSFEYLADRGRAKGLEGDAVYESIIESAQRTDAATNRSLGL